MFLNYNQINNRINTEIIYKLTCNYFLKERNQSNEVFYNRNWLSHEIYQSNKNKLWSQFKRNYMF